MDQMRLHLDTWYLKADRLVNAATRLPQVGPLDDHAGSIRRHIALRDLLLEWLKGLPTLEELLMTGKLTQGAPCVMIDTFIGKGLPDALRAKAKGSHSATPTLRRTMEVGVHAFEVIVPFSVENLTSQTAADKLSGKRRLHVCGFVSDLGAARIEVSPVAISSPLFGTDPRSGFGTQDLEIRPGDLFPRLDPMREVTAAEFASLRDIPEQQVKQAFAEILNEHIVPKDWGGETSDLFTTQAKVGDKRVRAAFAFKGPAAYHPMQPADLGKNGDQLYRLSTEPADVLVIQHCHTIKPAVMHTLRALASTAQPPKHYCIIDGYDTYRILSAYGRL